MGRRNASPYFIQISFSGLVANRGIYYNCRDAKDSVGASTLSHYHNTLHLSAVEKGGLDMTKDQVKWELINMNRAGYLLNPDQVNFLIDNCSIDELAYAITRV